MMGATKLEKMLSEDMQMDAKVNGLNSAVALSLPSGPIFVPDDDPWAMPELQDSGVKWSEYSKKQKCLRVIINAIKFALLVILLYLFICSLDFLSSAFRLLGGKAVGEIFQNSALLQNPLAGLMIGILATVIVQSSSTSTSIVVTMVASEIIDVPTAIPIIMGANIGTSVTNTLVSLTQCTDRNEFRRAFAAATVHDMFNWLSVVVFLTLEVTTGYLFHLTNAIVNSMNLDGQSGVELELLTVLTKPLTNFIIKLDKVVIEGVALGDPTYQNKSLIKEWCKTRKEEQGVNVTYAINDTNGDVIYVSNMTRRNVTIGVERCTSILNQLTLSDVFVGAILLVISLIILCTCLVLMVKILNSMLKGQVAKVIKKGMNASFPGKLAFLTGYLCMLTGCGMTILVQSSSIFTSTLTPLAGIGIITIERMYPLTLGSNIGTTTTGILASLAASGSQLHSSVQIALCHLFFNLSGILIFYPLPIMRWPIPLAKMMGNTTAKYRWFSVLYLFVAFLIVPGAIFGLSAAGSLVLMSVTIPVLVVLLVAIAINILQRKHSSFLPKCLQSWNWLPIWMHSLAPYDKVIQNVQELFVDKCSCSCCHGREEISVLENSRDPATSQTLMLPYSVEEEQFDTYIAIDNLVLKDINKTQRFVDS